jgi:DMSO/TMAO reductase YedYZ molybdopterin-dependent catalytic subunit
VSYSNSSSGVLRVGRRRFLGLLSAGYLASTKALRADHHVISAEPFEVEFDLASTTSRYTPVDDFYIRDHFPVPATPPLTIEISGAVERPMRMGPSELRALKRVELGAVLECAGDPVSTNALVSNGLWGGWRLADVLEQSQPGTASTHILLYGGDGYSRVVPIGRLSEGAILVCDLNSVPLRRSHGGPWRALFPGWYGMDSVKWVERIVVVTEAPVDTSYSYHQIRLDASGVRTEPLPRVQVKSVITSPRSGTSLPAGNIDVSGLAWSGNGGIEMVELSANGGAKWQQVSFEKRPEREWVSWRTSVDAKRRGALEVIVRARDASGQSQPQSPDPIRIDRYANNWFHRVRIAVV